MRITEGKIWQAFVSAVVQALNHAGAGEHMIPAMALLESKKEEVMKVLLTGDTVAINAKTMELVRTLMVPQ